MAQITPSILNADLADLRGEIAKISHADGLHVDVMDNHFVPNLTLGLPVVESMRRHTSLPMDIHLMIEQPDRWAPAYAEVGCELVTFHVEAAAAPVRTAREIRRLGSKVGLGIKPATPIEPYVDMLGEIDRLLIMSVEPGFGGQQFLDLVIPKIRRARKYVADSGFEVSIQMDGGISLETIERCAEAGADVFVAGTAVYRADDPNQMIDALREKATACSCSCS